VERSGTDTKPFFLKTFSSNAPAHPSGRNFRFGSALPKNTGGWRAGSPKHSLSELVRHTVPPPPLYKLFITGIEKFRRGEFNCTPGPLSRTQLTRAHQSRQLRNFKGEGGKANSNTKLALLSRLSQELCNRAGVRLALAVVATTGGWGPESTAFLWRLYGRIPGVP